MAGVWVVVTAAALTTVLVVTLVVAAYVFAVTSRYAFVRGGDGGGKAGGGEDELIIPGGHVNPVLYVVRALFQCRVSSYVPPVAMPLPSIKTRMVVAASTPSALTMYRVADAESLATDPVTGSTVLLPTHPQAMAEVMGIAATALAPGWPLPVIPFPIHTGQVIELYGPPMVVGEVLSFTGRTLPLRPTPRGLEIDFETVAHSNEGRLRFRGVMTGLYRSGKGSGKGRPGMKMASGVGAASHGASTDDVDGRAWVRHTWHVPLDKGWGYAHASGDFNPIHLSSWAGRVFGFEGCVAHGMWSMARIATQLAADGQWDFARGKAVPSSAAGVHGQGAEVAHTVFTAAFKRPLILPASPVFEWTGDGDVVSTATHAADHSILFRLTSGDGMVTHVEGSLLLKAA